MTTYRILPDGRRRALPDGGVRAVAAAGDIGSVIAAAPVVVEMAMTARVVFGTPVAIAAAPLVLAFGMVANIGHAVTATMTASPMVVEATMTASGYRTGQPNIYTGFSCTFYMDVRGLSAVAVPQFQRIFQRWYAAEAAGWAGLDAANRALAQNAGNLAGATASALVATNTNVATIDGKVTAVATRTTAVEARVTNAENTNTSQGTAISALQTTSTAHGTLLTSHSSQLTSVSASISDLNGDVTNIATATEVLEASVDSLGAAKALKGLYLDVNGYITGYQSINDGVTGQFNIMADVFRIMSNGTGARTECSDSNWRVYDSAGTLRLRWGVW